MSGKEVFAWGMYDLANTVFSALFVSFFFPFLIVNFLGGNEFHVGLVFGLSLLLVAISVPILGSISDTVKRRMPFIIFFTIACCIFTVLILIGNLILALLFGLIANFCYHAALTFYNSLLERFQTKKQGMISGIGIGMGYIGTILSLVVGYFVLMKYGWETIQGMQAIFITIAAMFLILSLFTFFGIREKAGLKFRASYKNIIKTAKHTFDSAKSIIKNKGMRSFLLGLFFYTNAINAVIIFLFLYARQAIGISVQEFFLPYGIFAVCAAIGSLIFGKLTDIYGGKKILIVAGFLWIIVILSLLAVTNYTSFLIAGSLGGAGMGIVWTAARPKLIKLREKKNIAEYFGFLAFTNKVSATIGPIILGFLATFVNYTAALLSLLVFFVLGLIFLKFVPKD